MRTKSVPMARSICLSVAATLMLASDSDAFAIVPASRSYRPAAHQTAAPARHHRRCSVAALHADLGSSSDGVDNPPDEKDAEVARLLAQASRLRAEAASLESEKAEADSRAAQRIFATFDTNDDGEVSFDELKAGLESVLKTELSEKRVQAVMTAFDTSGDGALQLDEFKTIEKFRSKLDSLAIEEQTMVKEAANKAKLAEIEAKTMEARAALLNDRKPTQTDKALSVLPYLFPLMDGLQYGRFLLADGEGNPIVFAVAVLYGLYRSIPLSGFVAFFALNFLSANTGINRLVRYNMQQAIFIDIALFFPGLLLGLTKGVLPAVGVSVPESIFVLPTDAVFVTLIVTLAYCAVSSVTGNEPSKLPVISKMVLDRMPTVDMFDEEGRFIPRDVREKDDDKGDEDKKK
mmetsp:Transcript_20771/g.41569  ORF Transcript_20771/g.41569 Transcript_20771/m.41569 type:complete len:405 (+) Transcript_20771:95-1309(+)